jgi:alginate O-acetyltransferase complex protein AlgI
VVEGITRITQGPVKKFVLGALVWASMERLAGGEVGTFVANVGDFSIAVVWAYLFLSLAYFYFDFSAYSDIAIGASRLFGLRIMENFNFPFLSTSLADFWRRWHMTLANFCRAYIYMSLIGLTRNPHVAIIGTFAALGAWHAASSAWLLWGIWNGVGLSVLLLWSRFAAKRKIQFFKTKIGNLTGWAATMAFVALGESLTLPYQNGSLWDSFRILAKAFGIDLL